MFCGHEVPLYVHVLWSMRARVYVVDACMHCMTSVCIIASGQLQFRLLYNIKCRSLYKRSSKIEEASEDVELCSPFSPGYLFLCSAGPGTAVRRRKSKTRLRLDNRKP